MHVQRRCQLKHLRWVAEGDPVGAMNRAFKDCPPAQKARHDAAHLDSADWEVCRDIAEQADAEPHSCITGFWRCKAGL